MYFYNRNQPACWRTVLFRKFEVKSSQNSTLIAMANCEELFSRHWGKAVLKSFAEETVLYSVHLHQSDGSIRKKKIDEILKVITFNGRV